MVSFSLVSLTPGGLFAPMVMLPISCQGQQNGPGQEKDMKMVQFGRKGLVLCTEYDDLREIRRLYWAKNNPHLNPNQRTLGEKLKWLLRAGL